MWRSGSETKGNTDKIITISDMQHAYALLKHYGPSNAALLQDLGVSNDDGTLFDLNPSSRVVVNEERSEAVKTAYEDFVNFINEVEQQIVLPWSDKLFIYNKYRIAIHPE